MTEPVGEGGIQEYQMKGILFPEPKVPFYGHDMKDSLSLQESYVPKKGRALTEIFLHEHHSGSTAGVRFDPHNPRAAEQVEK